MTKFALTSALALLLPLLAAAPAAAESVPVHVTYGDLDLSSSAGVKVLAQRVDAACERPDIRDIDAVVAWQQCREAARTSAMGELNGSGVAFDSAAFVAG